jgi:hypothetical protein
VTSPARLEGVPPALLAYACPLGGADESRRGDDSDDRAEEVELEDVARPQRARDESAVSAPAMPSTTLNQAPIRWRPGSTSRAPSKRPQVEVG